MRNVEIGIGLGKRSGSQPGQWSKKSYGYLGYGWDSATDQTSIWGSGSFSTSGNGWTNNTGVIYPVGTFSTSGSGWMSNTGAIWGRGTYTTEGNDWSADSGTIYPAASYSYTGAGWSAISGSSWGSTSITSTGSGWTAESGSTYFTGSFSTTGYGWSSGDTTSTWDNATFTSSGLDWTAIGGSTWANDTFTTTGQGWTGETASSGFDPADLFTGSEEGATYDPSDSSTIFEERTSPTTTPGTGDPVGTIQDRSGNGHDLVADSDSGRPLLTAANLMDFQNSGWLQNTTLDMSGWTDMTYLITFEAPSTEDAAVIVSSDSSSEYAGFFDDNNGNNVFSSGAGTPTFHTDNSAAWTTNDQGHSITCTGSKVVIEGRSVNFSNWDELRIFYYTVSSFRLGDGRVGRMTFIETSVFNTGTNAADLRTWHAA